MAAEAVLFHFAKQCSIHSICDIDHLVTTNLLYCHCERELHKDMSMRNTFLDSFQQVLPCWEVSVRKAVKNILQTAPILLELSPLGPQLLSILFIIGIGQIPVDLPTSVLLWPNTP